MAKVSLNEIDLLGHSLEYEVRKSAEASEPRIDVDIHGVAVIVPENDSIQPSELLKENAAWVVDKKQSYDKYRKEIPKRVFEVGESFPFLGEKLELVIEPRPTHEVDGDSIRLRKSSVSQSSVKQALKNVYRAEAREHFTNRANHYSEEMGVEYEQIEIRNQRTKWGSCSTTGTLGLNWRLMMAPPAVIDYIVVHELAHLQEQNHTREFWRLVERHIPDYKFHAEWLDENSVKLIFTTDDL